MVKLNELYAQVDYELKGGKFDGTVFRLGSGVSVETPPKTIQLVWKPNESQKEVVELYTFDQRVRTYTDAGEPIDEEIAYYHEDYPRGCS